jgi:hypothetical protein
MSAVWLSGCVGGRNPGHPKKCQFIYQWGEVDVHILYVFFYLKSSNNQALGTIQRNFTVEAKSD